VRADSALLTRLVGASFDNAGTAALVAPRSFEDGLTHGGQSARAVSTRAGRAAFVHLSDA
jgi:hypothetical protein